MEFTQYELIMLQSALETKLRILEEQFKDMDVELNLKEAKSALQKVQKYLKE